MNGLHVAFIGRVGTEPELKYTQVGKAVVNFSVAVVENRSGGDGAEVTWIRVSCWEDLAEQLSEHLRKGGECYIEGRLKLSTWTGHDGEQRSSLNVSAWRCEVLGKIGRSA